MLDYPFIPVAPCEREAESNMFDSRLNPTDRIGEVRNPTAAANQVLALTSLH